MLVSSKGKLGSLAYSVTNDRVTKLNAESSVRAFVAGGVIRQLDSHRRRCISCQLVVELRQVYRRSVYTIADYECSN